MNMFTGINKELLHNIIEQEIGYYKVELSQTVANIYGESTSKSYRNPVKIYCLVERQPQETTDDNFGPDRQRTLNFAFLRADLVDKNTVPEIGDVGAGLMRLLDWKRLICSG